MRPIPSGLDVADGLFDLLLRLLIQLLKILEESFEDFLVALARVELHSLKRFLRLLAELDGRCSHAYEDAAGA